jgi:DNA polymerase-3 subunit epsilon
MDPTGWWAAGRAAWQRLRGSDPSTSRWIVLDVETTGLDPHRDRLLAIAAVALRMDSGRPVVELADSFDAVLRQGGESPGPGPTEGQPPGGDKPEPIDKANILVHGIGVGAMRAGHEPAEVLRQFDAWAGDAPRLGFHVAFDQAVIERAQRRFLGPGRARRATWIDIEPLAAVAHPEVKARALDEWLTHFGIRCLRRHQAIADTLATAELLQRLWPRLQREGATDAPALARLAAAGRWARQR